MVDGDKVSPSREVVALTREFLLERGYCCGNICKNCPYGEDIQRAAAGKKIRV